MNKEKWRDNIHKVFLFRSQKNVKEFSKDSTLTNIVQTQRFHVYLYVGSHPCILLSSKGDNVGLNYAITTQRLYHCESPKRIV